MQCQEEERVEVENDSRSGRPSISRNNENIARVVRQKVHGDHQLTVQMIANELGISCKKVWTIITEGLGMKKICSKMVPYFLNEDQMEWRVQVCHDILESSEPTC